MAMPVIIWGGTEWEARFPTGEVVRCASKTTLEGFLNIVDNNGRRSVRRLQALERRRRRLAAGAVSDCLTEP